MGRRIGQLGIRENWNRVSRSSEKWKFEKKLTGKWEFRKNNFGKLEVRRDYDGMNLILVLPLCNFFSAFEICILSVHTKFTVKMAPPER